MHYNKAIKPSYDFHFLKSFSKAFPARFLPQLMCELLYVVLVGLTVSSPIAVNVHYTATGLPYLLDGVITGLSAQSQPVVHLGIGRASFIDLGSDVSSDETLTGEILTQNMITLCSGQNPASRYFADRDDTVVTVGIGPGSTPIDTYGTISMIRNGTTSGQMIFAGDFLAFNESCVSGSVLRIPYNYTAHNAIHLIRLTFRLSFANRVITTDSTGPAGFGGNSRIATLPYAFAVEISRLLVRSGASQVETNVYSFRNCNRDILLGRLPDLVLGIGENSGELVLGPEDYIHFDRREFENQCWFKFGVESVNTHVWLFNPLVIASVNVHITNGELFICDSVH